MRKWRLSVISVCLLAFLTGCGLLTGALSPRIDHLALGNPSNATPTGLTPNNYLMTKPQFALSYNRKRGIPNWVSWQLDSGWLGDVERQNDFRPDSALPEQWERVTPTDYRRSGYDRGHLAPSGDRTNTQVNNSATFLMTNIIPQAADINRGPWVDLEQYCRYLVDRGKELYIVAGGYGKRDAIATGKIIPPNRVWKVVVVLDAPGQGPEGISPQTRVIAVDMPNQNGDSDAPWTAFTVSVDSLEHQTGYDFLRKVPKSVQDSIEVRVDRGKQKIRR
ncbi:Nuclease [Acaryochloris thomasi RCC1774]|uniref:Endonuclease n=1 Tax=Acaryochloris thomasi RCC1774 TaxID=1764569 RepID=A0A2W1JN25_9CYAN|nr:Nuclease [Acaryochloris thomasi RCC1774]